MTHLPAGHRVCMDQLWWCLQVRSWLREPWTLECDGYSGPGHQAREAFTVCHPDSRGPELDLCFLQANLQYVEWGLECRHLSPSE